MRHSSVQDDLQDGIDLETAPAMGPDGGYAVPPPKPFDPPPRLCEQGPCRHYHALGILVDAERPKGAGVGADGRVVGQGEVGPDHVGRHHYCYPDVGIETELGSLPVVECNRWDPVPNNAIDLDARRQRYIASDDGQAYLTAVDAWRARQQEAQEASMREADEAMRIMDAAERARAERVEREARAVRATIRHLPDRTSAPSWVADAPDIGVHTQGETNDEAEAMLIDAIQSLVNVDGFTASIMVRYGDLVLVEGSDPNALADCMAKYRASSADVETENNVTLADEGDAP